MNSNFKDVIKKDIQGEQQLNEIKSKDQYILDIKKEVSDYIIDLAKQFKVTGNNTEEILKNLETTPAVNQVKEIRTLQREFSLNPQLGIFPTNIKIEKEDLTKPPTIPISPESELITSPTTIPTETPSQLSSIPQSENEKVEKSDFRVMIETRRLIDNINKNAEVTRGKGLSEDETLEYLRTQQPKLYKVYIKIFNLYHKKVRPALKSYNFGDDLKKEYNKLYNENLNLWRAAKYFLMSDKRFAINKIYAEIFDQFNYPEEGKRPEESPSPQPKPGELKPGEPKPGEPKPGPKRKPRSPKNKTDNQLQKKYSIFIRDHITGGETLNLRLLLASMKIRVNQNLSDNKSNTSGAIIAFKINPDEANTYYFKAKIPYLNNNTLGAGSSDSIFKKLRSSISSHSGKHSVDEAVTPLSDVNTAATVLLSALADYFGKAYRVGEVSNKYNPDNKTAQPLTKDYLEIFNMYLKDVAVQVATSWKEFIDVAKAYKEVHQKDHPEIASQAMGAAVNTVNAVFRLGIPNEYGSDKEKSKLTKSKEKTKEPAGFTHKEPILKEFLLKKFLKMYFE